MNALEPIFDEEFPCSKFPDNSNLELIVYDQDPSKPDDVLGKAVLTASELKEGYNGEAELTETGADKKSYIKFMVKVGDNDYPKGPPSQFIANLGAKGADLGLAFDIGHPTSLYLGKLPEAGPIKDYNAKADVDSQLKAGQYITAVNGVGGTGKVLSELVTTTPKVEFTVRRPMQFTVAFDGGPLGLEVGIDTTSLIVSKIDDGSKASKWGIANPALKIEENDRIIAVNGKRDTGANLCECLKTAKSIRLIISRPCPQETSGAGAAKAAHVLSWFTDLF